MNYPDKKPQKQILATEEDVRRLAEKIDNSFSLCSFMGKAEKEYMVAYNITSCVNNLDNPEYGKLVSFKGNVSSTHDNWTSYQYLIEEGFFVEDTFQDKIVVLPTQKLINKLDRYFNREKEFADLR